MALARFKDLCIDAHDADRVGTFWAKALNRSWDVDEERIVGQTPTHTVWICSVPEAKQAKHRVHLDIYVRTLAELEAIGSTVVCPAGQGRAWTVMGDPEGGEYCAFLRDEPPAERLHGLVVDSIDPFAQARWWSEIYGATYVEDPGLYATVTDVPAMPILTMDFVPVPESKSVKNRIHWDVVADVSSLVSAGATLLRPSDAEIRWSVMADPEGNEFCAFADN